MTEIFLKTCRICLDENSSDNLVDLNDTQTKMFRFLKIDLNMALIDNPVICKSCTHKLQNYFEFKSISLNNYEYLNTFKTEDKPMINIEEIVVCPLLNKGIKVEVKKVCLFCLKFFNLDDLICLNECQEDSNLTGLIDKCIPQVDYTLIAEPYACTNCAEFLKDQFTFAVSCLNTEEAIIIYTNLKDINSNKINIHAVLEQVKSLKKEVEVDCNIKKEIRPLSPHADLKIEQEECVTEADSINDKSKDSKRVPSKQNSKTRNKYQDGKLVKTLYSCPHCLYKNRVKANLMSHLLVHETIDNLKNNQWKCDLCNFRSKWRSSLLTHKLLHKNLKELTLFKCYNCSYETKYKKHLRRHMKRHNIKLYCCQKCNYKTKTKSRLETHNCKKKHNKGKRSSHEDEFIKAEPLDQKIELISDEPVDQEFELIKCTEQKVKVTESEPKVKGIKLIQPELGDQELPIANREETKESTNEEYQRDEVFSKITKIIEFDSWYYTCNTCEYKSKKFCHMSEHLTKHENVRIKCYICDYQAKYRRTLKNHMKKRHNI